MPSPILSTPRKETTEETWAIAPEDQPLLEASKTQAASVTSRSPSATPMGIDPAAAPPGTAPIQLPPDVDLSAEYPFNDQPIIAATGSSERSSITGVSCKAPGWTMSISTDTKSVLRYIGRGCFIMILTPIAFVGMAMYATGAILEGVAMVMKGVGAFGGNLMLAKRVEGQRSPVIQPSVAWV